MASPDQIEVKPKEPPVNLPQNQATLTLDEMILKHLRDNTPSSYEEYLNAMSSPLLTT